MRSKDVLAISFLCQQLLLKFKIKLQQEDELNPESRTTGQNDLG